MKKPEQNKTAWLDIWKLDLPAPATNEFKFLKDLSTEEKERAAKFIHHYNRRNYIVAHYFLRDVLSKYVGLRPKSIAFESGLNGKPLLRNKFPLYFNLSYRNRLFVIGISEISQTGVDVESIRKIDDIAAFCKNFFSDNEIKIINEASGEEQLKRIFKFWTIKESFIKATAKAFSEPLPLHDLHIFFNKKDVQSGRGEPGWNIGPIEVPEGYKASYAVAADTLNLKVFDYALPHL